MRTRGPALILYFIACIVAVIASYIESDALLVLSKPIVIPAIYFYYLSAKDTKVNPLIVLFLFLSFVGDTIVMLDIQNSTLIIMVPYFLSYLILVWFAIQDCRKISFSRFGAWIGAFIFSMIVALVFMLTQSFADDQHGLIVPIIGYGVLLAVYGGLAGYYFYSTASNIGLLLIMSALFCIVSDVFYVVFILILVFPGFLAFILALQLLAYYFLVRYFILRRL